HGYAVWAPLLPDNRRPDAQKYWDFLHSQGWDFKDTVLVGHSSGATRVLNLLASEEFPKIKAAVLAGVFLNERLTNKSPDFPDKSQFARLFPEDGFDWEEIKQKADKFYFVHGDNDPYCSYEDARKAAKKVQGKLVTVDKGGHLTVDSGVL